MRAKHFWIAVLFSGFGATAPAMAMVEALSSVSNPSLQTLIDMGSTPVSVGGVEFSNFSLLNSLTATGVTADQIQVVPSNGGSGLQFVSSWVAANGSNVDEVISFDVLAMDAYKPIAQISLLSNGTAPAPTSGTFTTNTLVSELPNGSAATNVISTYDDGFTTPVDTTKADNDFVITWLTPQTELHISDTVFESSTAATGTDSGGVAAESIVQNTFAQVQVPEPGPTGWMMVPVAAVVTTLNRRGRTKLIA